MLNILLDQYEKTANKWGPAGGWFLLVRGWPPARAVFLS
jgi:hypothetical protein